MKIKKFKAKSFGEALELIKKELSEDAIILSTEEKKGIRPFVEVTAAVDYDGPGAQQRLDDGSRKQGEETALRKALTPSLPADASRPVSVAADEIRDEIGRLRDAIEGMKNTGYEIALPARKRMMLNYLRERSVRDEFALRLCEKARDVDDIASLISADIRVKERSNRRRAVMLIGPTGVGKTTTIAKLSAMALKEGRRVAVISFDTYRIGAVEQMRIYTRIMGIPLAIVSSVAELRSSLQGCAKTRDIVFIDTAGRNPREEAYIDGLLEIFPVSSDHEPSLELPLELHLLMSAGADDECMIEAYRSYRRLPIDSIAFTKVDEAVRFGSLYNLMLTYQKPVAYITTGQTVPDDLEFTNHQRLANLILTKGSYRC